MTRNMTETVSVTMADNMALKFPAIENENSFPLGSLGRHHAKRLREVYRSAGWRYQDMVEVELIAAGMLERRIETTGHEVVRVTDRGMAYLARSIQKNRTNRAPHEVLVERIAHMLAREGRLVWTNLSLRARVLTDDEEVVRWRLCRPDVFSIRNTTVAGYMEPIVHEIKVSRADLLGDLKLKHKRDSYLDVGGQCWYVLGCDSKGRPIGQEADVPGECGVLIAEADKLHVARNAAKRPAMELPFPIWMALAKATPHNSLEMATTGDLKSGVL
jgi:hypothetical protein